MGDFDNVYTGFYGKRFKRIIGKLSKNGKVLEDVFAVVPMPTEHGYFIGILVHLDTAEFSVDNKYNRIQIDVKKKHVEDLKPLSAFARSNVTALLDSYNKMTSIIELSRDIKDVEKMNDLTESSSGIIY